MPRREAIGELAVRVGVDAENFRTEAEAKVHEKAEAAGRSAGRAFREEFEDETEDSEPRIDAAEETGEAAAAGRAAGEAYKQQFEDAADDLDADVDQLPQALDAALERSEEIVEESDLDIDLGPPDPEDLEGDLPSQADVAMRRSFPAVGEEFEDIEMFDLSPRARRNADALEELDDTALAAARSIDQVADDEDFRELEALETEVNALRGALRGFFKLPVQGQMGVAALIGTVLPGAVGTGVGAGAGIGGAILSGRLNEQLQELNAILPDTEMNIAGVRAQIERLSQIHGETPRALTKQLYRAAEEGMTDMRDALDAVAVSADLKATGAFDKLGKAFDSVLELINASQEPLEETDRTINQVFEAARRGTGGFEDYVGALGDMQTELRGTEASTAETVSALVALEDRQTSTSEAAEILRSRIEESGGEIDDLGAAVIENEGRLQEYRQTLSEVRDGHSELVDSAEQARQNIEDTARQVAASLSIELREIGFAILPEIRDMLRQINEQFGHSAERGRELNDELTRIEDSIENIGQPFGGAGGIVAGITPMMDPKTMQQGLILLENLIGTLGGVAEMWRKVGDARGSAVESMLRGDPGLMREAVWELGEAGGIGWERLVSDPIKAALNQLPQQRLSGLEQVEIAVSNANEARRTRNRLIHRGRVLNDIYSDAAKENNRDLMRAIRRRIDLRQQQLETVRRVLSAEEDYEDAIRRFGDSSETVFAAFQSELQRVRTHYDALIARAEKNDAHQRRIAELEARRARAVNSVVAATEEQLENVGAEREMLDRVVQNYVRVRDVAEGVRDVAESTARVIREEMAASVEDAEQAWQDFGEGDGLVDTVRQIREGVGGRGEMRDIVAPPGVSPSEQGPPGVLGLDENQLRRLEELLRDPRTSAEELRQEMERLGISMQNIRQDATASAVGLAQWAAAVLDGSEKSEDAEESTSDLRDTVRDLSRAASGAIELANAIGVIDDESARALQSVTQLAAATAQFASGNWAAGAASAMSGIAGIVGAMAGPSDREKVIRENTEALNALRNDIQTLRGALSETPGEVLGVQERLDEFVERIPEDFGPGTEGLLPEDRPFGTSDLDLFGEAEATKSEVQDFLDTIGLTWTEFRRQAERMGVSVEKLSKAYREGEASADAVRQEVIDFNKALQELRLEQLFEGFEGQLGRLEARFELFDIEDPIDQLAAFRNQFMQFSDMPFDEQFDIAQADLTTEEGRRRFEKALQRIFEMLASGELDPSNLGGIMGDMTPAQLRDFLTRMEGLVDQAAEEAESGGVGETPGSTQSLQVTREITEVTANRMVGTLTTISVLARQRNRMLQGIATHLGASVPDSIAAPPRPPSARGGTTVHRGGDEIAVNLDRGAVQIVSDGPLDREDGREAGRGFVEVLDSRLGSLERREDRRRGRAEVPQER